MVETDAIASRLQAIRRKVAMNKTDVQETQRQVDEDIDRQP